MENKLRKVKIENMSWKNEVRPCIVDGRKALWHRWVEVRQCISAGLTVMNDHPGGFISDTLALVEYEGGDVAKVPVSAVRFTQTKRLFERNSVAFEMEE